jgi:hypothetical protein
MVPQSKEETEMRKVGRLLAGSASVALLCTVAAWAQNAATKKIPDLMAGGFGWESGGGMTPVPGSPSPVTQDPRFQFVGNNTGKQTDGTYTQPNWRHADLNNPNLTEFAKEGLRKANAMKEGGFSMYSRTARCQMPGVPIYNLSPGRTFFLQTPEKVVMIWQRDQIHRTVWLNQEHSKNLKPSWHGESVGHYEGDELVVTTVGQSTKIWADQFRTPVSDKLKVTERFRLIEDGKALQVEMTIEDPVAFVKPWKVTKRWTKSDLKFEEIRCMDGESVNPFNQQQAAVLDPLPTASKPDF